MTKKDVYVVVDTPKKAKKLKKLLDMFGERTYSNSSIQDCLDNNKNVIGFEKEDNAFMSSYVDQFDNFRKKVSIKELRNILAKEHLKVGDVFVGKNGMYKFIGVYKGFTKRGLIEVSNWHNLNKDIFLDNISNSGGCFENFKRYATPEEIALLKPKEVDKFAELKEAESKGKVLECKANGFGDSRWILKTHKGFVDKLFEYRIKPEDPVKVGDWMFNTNSKKITQVKKENHGKSLIGSGWVKIKDTELVEKLNSL